MSNAILTEVLTAHRWQHSTIWDCSDELHYLGQCACGPVGDWTTSERRPYDEWVAHVVALIAAETQAAMGARA